MSQGARPNPYTLTRLPGRGLPDRASLYAVLDAAPFGTLSTVVDGLPWVVPMLFARDGDQVLLHGSTGAGALRQVADGAPVAFSVMLVDAIVVADSTFESSANYRSAVVHGTPVVLDGDAKAAALQRLSDNVIPGRSAEVRATTAREFSATYAMSLPITDGRWIVKARTGPSSENPGEPGVWQGLVPVRLEIGAPEPAPWIPADVPVPASVRRLHEHGWQQPGPART